jgi:hypothetical protein
MQTWPRAAPTPSSLRSTASPPGSRAARRAPGTWASCTRTGTSGCRARFIDLLRAEPDLCVGENQPYAGHLPGDAIDRHALSPGRPNALIELRHDLIADAGGQRAWAERLAPLLEAARARANL